mmetsp:Transcript_19040/g.24510  ORF Transcript_19040/g.24510 Transcript_19040/m.24510 type:complete len:124 (-) Transcript_19040:42-413(-)|eukprot:CAMPEP_0198155598 /NCGR_PEP_ID=MMETSP1443-20131203/69219_1 /TAXON_ID=186043 /ORGANISM="Entomoneis sp., Strain CCMP2396" /LENGTH=123 /DNA_ID=CAMNT_0043822353 /DNA_START=60 /DNA_END=431 /DNA_ORIENTATION=+
MHPLVRDLYKRVLHVGQDYPTGIDHVKQVWKKAIRNPKNCPSCYDDKGLRKATAFRSPTCEEELLHNVYQGRHMVKEMIGVIQLKKYRAMKERYGSNNNDELQLAMIELESQANTGIYMAKRT